MLSFPPFNNESLLKKSQELRDHGVYGAVFMVFVESRADPHWLAEVNYQVQQGCLWTVFS